MRGSLLLCVLILLCHELSAQYIYTIKADSVKITNCDSSELIIENHTQNVPGFLFNTGNGRTIFKRGALKLTDTSYLVGGDTVKWRNNAWVQGGNTFGATGVLGTNDSNHLDLYTSNTQQARITKTGNFLIGGTADNFNKLQVNGPVSINAVNRVSGVAIPLTLLAGGGFAGAVGFISHGMILQTCCTTTSFFQFRFGGDTSMLGTGGVRAITLDGRNGDNIAITSPSNYLDLLGVQNIALDASPMYLTSGGYSGMDGVVVQRSGRDTSRIDPLFSVKEFDTVVMRVCKNGNVGVGTPSPQAQLHTTGSVRFAGLTSDSTQTRVVVADPSGNLFYSSVSSLGAWKQGGNSFGTTGVLGTLDNNHLDLYTNATARARITNTGRLLLGTTVDNGVHILQVNGGMLLAKDASISGITVGCGGVPGVSDATNVAVGRNALVSSLTSTGNAAIGCQAMSSLQSGTSNVAIGPYALYGNASGSYNVSIGFQTGYFNSAGSGNVFIGSQAGTNETGSNKLYISNSATANLIYGDFSTSQVMINPASIHPAFPTSARFIVNGDSYLSDTLMMGKVPAGTSADSVLVINSSSHAVHKIAQSSLVFNGVLNSSLAVNGGINAERLTLTTRDWPDFVFDSTYQLLPLTQVADYIRDHHHLPGVVSAAVAKKDGADVGLTQEALLKKIEELTLYSIEQDKKVIEQQTAIGLLKDRLSRLEQLITNKLENK